MTRLCERVLDGFNCDFTYGNDLQVKECEKIKKQWKLLFQLDTDNFELMFNDCGRIYYYIKEDDLKNKNFDNIWLILQSY